MLVLKVDRKRHYLPPQPVGEFGRHIAREFPRDDLFIYFHTGTRNWVVARWANRARGEALELCLLGPTPFGTQTVIDRLRTMLKADHTDASLMPALAAADKADLEQHQMDDWVRKEANRKLVRDCHPRRQ